MTRDHHQKKYFDLGNDLPNIYPHHNFDNHCYWRIALDNAVGDMWKKKVKSPAYKNLSEEQLDKVIHLLENYKTDEQLLLEHNQNSLRWRNKK